MLKRELKHSPVLDASILGSLLLELADAVSMRCYNMPVHRNNTAKVTDAIAGSII
jgi:hypothetical protein